MESRVFIYAFLSKVYADVLDKKAIEDLKSDENLLATIGQESQNYFASNDIDTIYEALNDDFSSIFLMNAQPLESSIVDSKEEVLVGLQNPVMQFYFDHGYDLNLASTHIQTPDHISLEFAFMQNLIQRGDERAYYEFLKAHVIEWVPHYLIAIGDMATTVFYKELFDFSVEFVATEYEALLEKFDGQ